MRGRRRRTIAFLLAIGVGLTAASRAAEQDPAAEAAELAALMRVGAGSRVADVGAGKGEWALRWAERVGETGRVWATEVTDELVAAIRRAAVEAGVDNLEAIRGDDRRSGLAAGCCDVVLLRMVYHHFTEPAAMRADLARALAPGGRLVIVDTVPQKHWRRLEGTPERGGHGVAPEEAIAEWRAEGFELIERRDAWMGDPDRYALVLTPQEIQSKAISPAEP
ncbi:MAG: methyltransferase domain-containing protein [Thermoanaerobaculia bacterium]|nr:MAG: methyltransferase domain-containing protein [Thermoanaerobaculia bacterium]MBZ0101259.1 methyltransferase domain-containing protein [Thermoanaerobaculia bacterium]